MVWDGGVAIGGRVVPDLMDAGGLARACRVCGSGVRVEHRKNAKTGEAQNEGSFSKSG